MAAHFRSPDQIYRELFEAVQSAPVFADSKTFADAVPQRPVDDILRDFAATADRSAAALQAFVAANFRLPEDAMATSTGPVDLRRRIESLWDRLKRTDGEIAPGSSLIPLPRPYVVPGGRFREVYYWDAYFTMLGLAESGRIDTVADMVANFAHLIDRVGFIPNGSRSYFCTRSHPPFFAHMVELLATLRGDAGIVHRYLPQLEREYAFWMDGESDLGEAQSACRRVVRLGDAHLNRYWDDAETPRPESYAEDLAVAAASRRSAPALYRDLRAACESGWDFSSRWLGTPTSLGSIRTTRVVPVDLNALLYHLERVLADANGKVGGGGSPYAQCAEARATSLRTLFFDDAAGLFVDVSSETGRPTGVLSLAGVLPLFVGVATDAQAARVASTLEARFLAPGGWRTSLTASGQQWDRPNGWAPLQWIVYQGLCRYGFDDLAERGARAWVDSCTEVYRQTGRLLEKYDVDNVGALPGGGEYAVQDGFGWTNGVLLGLLNRLDPSTA